MYFASQDESVNINSFLEHEDIDSPIIKKCNQL